MVKQKWFPRSLSMSCPVSAFVFFVSVMLLLLPATTFAQSKNYPSDKFKQMDDLLPTPNEQRTASGAPGNRYWQQRADYDIKVEIDDLKQRLSASETITYQNNSPDSLAYLWVQLDQNIWTKDAESLSTQAAPNLDNPSFATIDALIARRDFEGGKH